MVPRLNKTQIVGCFLIITGVLGIVGIVWAMTILAQPPIHQGIPSCSAPHFPDWCWK